MKGHGEKLNRKEEAALAALLTSPTIGEAARATGISESTLFRWLRREDFQTRYREAKAEAVSHAVTRLQQSSTQAVDTLMAVMSKPDASDSARVMAAKITLELAIKGTEIEELKRRLKVLEDAERDSADAAVD